MVFEALSFNESECGSKIKGSKKRFVWTFKIDGEVNTLELVASFMTGKRKVFHNDREIYKEKQLLNIKFEYTYKIGSHMFRIIQKQNKFQMVVDSCLFDDWLRNRGFTNQDKKKKTIDFNNLEENVPNDPFAEFGKISKKTSSKNNDHNAFGEFEDFGFSTGTTQQKSKFENEPSKTTFNQHSSKNPSFEDIFSNSKSANQIQASTGNSGFNFGSSVQNPQNQAKKTTSNQVMLLDLL